MTGATHCYVGTMPCGCHVAAAVDMPDDRKATALSVREYVERGYVVSRVPLEDLRSGALKLARCIHKAAL